MAVKTLRLCCGGSFWHSSLEKPVKIIDSFFLSWFMVEGAGVLCANFAQTLLTLFFP